MRTNRSHTRRTSSPGHRLLRWAEFSVVGVSAWMLVTGGCAPKPPAYGVEERLKLPAKAPPQSWAVTPVIDLSGQGMIDPLLQADIVFSHVQRVRGITAVPVNRTAEVLAGLGIPQIRSQTDADLVCEALGVDALLVTSVTAYDPYDPPRVGAAVALFVRQTLDPSAETLDPRTLAGRTGGAGGRALPRRERLTFLQASGYFDAADGSTRASVASYAAGRSDPIGPTRGREFLLDAERYCGFVYATLLEDLLERVRLTAPSGR